MVSTPESLVEAEVDSDGSEVVPPTFGGTTIVSVLLALVGSLVFIGGNGEATIELRPFWISDLVKVLASTVGMPLDVAVVGCEPTGAKVVELTGIEVKPAAILSVTVDDAALLVVLVVAAVSVAGFDVSTGIEVNPAATISVVV